MKTNDGEQDWAADREMRIAEMKGRLREIAGGDLPCCESSALAPDLREGFWRHVTEVETAPQTTDFERLIKAGVQLPHPDALDDSRLTTTLGGDLRPRAATRIHVRNGSSERSGTLTWLWHDVLREEVPDLPVHPLSCSHVSLFSGSDTDIALYLKYYADESYRRNWRVDWPEYDMPGHEDPPYDRDRHLPQPDRAASA